MPFRWYSILMHLILFNYHYYFSQGFDLEIEKDREKLPVQLWTIIFSSNWEEANLGLFENDFFYMLRRKLVSKIENFPFLLKCFIRPMDYDVKPLNSIIGEISIFRITPQ